MTQIDTLTLLPGHNLVRILCVFRHRAGESRGGGGGADPVKLRPGHGHAAVVVGVVAGAAESLLGQEDQVLLRQAPVALHLGLVLHVDGVAQLRPQHLVRHEERHPSLPGAAETAEKLHTVCCLLQGRGGGAWTLKRVYITTEQYFRIASVPKG